MSLQKTYRLFAFLILLVISCRTIPADWQIEAEMPTARQEIYASVANGRIYIIGGILTDIVTTSSAFEAFDANSGHWIQLQSLPVPRHHITPVTIDGKIYAMGGFDGPYPAWELKADMFIYDMSTDTWREGVSLPISQGEHIAVAVADKIHVIGGRIPDDSGKSHFDSYVDTDKHHIFDVKTGLWTKGTPAPTARNSAAATVIDGLIYVVGGRKNVIQDDGTQLQENLSTLEVYDPKTDLWKTLKPMPEALGGNAAATVDGMLYVFGGEQWSPEHKVFSNTWIYEPEQDHWYRGTDLPTARHGLAAAAIDGVLYTIGGCTKVGGGAAVGITESVRP